MRLSPDLIERVLSDRQFWRKMAREIIEGSSQNQPTEVDSAIAGSFSLGPVMESRRHQRDSRVRLVRDPGPRRIPMISEVRTVNESGVLLTEAQARRIKRAWDRRRLREQENNSDQSSIDKLADHPGQSCDDAHPGMSHNDFLVKQEEEEEERSNPLFRQNSASANSYSPNRLRRTRER